MHGERGGGAAGKNTEQNDRRHRRAIVNRTNDPARAHAHLFNIREDASGSMLNFFEAARRVTAAADLTPRSVTREKLNEILRDTRNETVGHVLFTMPKCDFL